MENQIEIWKDVVGHEGIYKVSNLGNVKSLSRISYKRGKYPFTTKEKIMKLSSDTSGYLIVVLNKNNIKKTRTVHQLVAESFLNHKRCGRLLVVNHKDFNKQNNNVNNIEIVTTRENSNRKHIKSSSQYVGVHWYKKYQKWASCIVIGRKIKFLGYFEDELEASQAYQNALSNITNQFQEF